MFNWKQGLRLKLVSVLRTMTSGRTAPLLGICEHPETGEQYDVVIKTLVTLESGVKGMAREFICSHMANLLGIPTLTPVIVEIDNLAAFGKPLPNDLADRIKASIGNNFGTLHLKDVALAPRGQSLKGDSLAAAAEVFAFDLLVQNADRRTANPNLFWDGSYFIVFDHEQALPFSMILGGFNQEPWDVAGLHFVRDHFFFSRLSGTLLDLGGFVNRLKGCSEEVIDGIINEVPEEWVTDEIAMIRKHLVTAGVGAETFVEAVQAEVSV